MSHMSDCVDELLERKNGETHLYRDTTPGVGKGDWDIIDVQAAERINDQHDRLRQRYPSEQVMPNLPFPGTTFVTSETGGVKGQKDIQLSMVPVEFLMDLGRLYGFGAQKYDRNNWRRGYAWSLSFDALMRHLLAAWGGEWIDPESGLPHVVHVAWHCATLHTYMAEGLGTDDRA